MASRYRRLEPARTGVLISGIAAAAASFTMLCMNATALTVQTHGTLPSGSPHRAYDILVRMPSWVSQQSATAAAVRPTDLTELSGGITLAQYDKIRSLPGVQVAAPMTMIGYVPLTAVIPVAVPAAAIAASPALYTLTARQKSDDGLSTQTLQNAGRTYYLVDQACPRSMPAPLASATAGSTPARAACWSTATGSDAVTWPGPRPMTVSVPLTWTFWLPLVAVDPTAEARLLHLNRAVTKGHYLPTTRVSSASDVPVIIASSFADDQTDQLSLVRLPASAAGISSTSRTASLVGAVTGTSAAQQVGTSTVTAAQAYQTLLRYLGEAATVPVPAYWSPSPASYRPLANGALTPQPVTSAAGTTGFRGLTVHVARTGSASGSNGVASVAPAALRAVGVFDPTRIVSSAATPSPYLGEKLVGADTRSQWLLSGMPLGPDGNPAGYPSPGATLVMPMQDIGAFASAARYTGANSRAPIGSIRVRVAGAAGDHAVSRERVRVVAQEIVRATGLHVEVTLAASAAIRTIDLPAGRNGRPVLHLSEAWYRTDTPTTVTSALDPRSVALSAVVLLMGGAFAASGVLARVRRRRREFATLRALGWARGRLTWRFAREFGLITAATGGLAALVVYVAGSVVMGRVAAGWLLLSIAATVVMTLGAAWWPVRRATGGPAPRADAAGSPDREQRGPAGVLGHAMRNLRRAPGRSMLGVFVIAVACAALGLELVVRWLFGGVIVGSWSGFAVSWQQQPIDAAAVITILALATAASADLGWRNGGERAGDRRTLRAIGWPLRDLARVDACEAALVGVTGGVIAIALDAACLLAIGHQPPAGLAVIAVAVVGAGVVISLIAAALCAAAWCATRTNATA